MRKLTTVFSAICAPLAALLGGLSLATPVVAQSTTPATITVRGNMRLVITMAAVLGESSPEPGSFFVLTPAGQKDNKANNLLVGSVARTLMGGTGLNQALEGFSCTFTLTGGNTGGWHAIKGISGCTPPQ